MFQCWDNLLFFRSVIAIDRDVIEEHMSKFELRRNQRIDLDPESLQWTPLISSMMLEIEEKCFEDEVSDILGTYVFVSGMLLS